jgi:hypothetical protein
MCPLPVTYHTVDIVNRAREEGRTAITLIFGYVSTIHASQTDPIVANRGSDATVGNNYQFQQITSNETMEAIEMIFILW